VHKWVVCRVIAVLTRTQFLVYFEGWSEVYIMWVDKERDAQRIRAIHSKHLTGLGSSGPVEKQHFENMLHGSTYALSQPLTSWPIPPCTYLPCLYYYDIPNLGSCHLNIRVRDPERLVRLQAPREPHYVPTRELQARMPPLWLGHFPHESDEPFYGPNCRATHNYHHDPYPNEEALPTPHDLMTFYLNQFNN